MLRRLQETVIANGKTVGDLNGSGPLDLVTFSSDPGVVHATVATNKGLNAGRRMRGGRRRR